MCNLLIRGRGVLKRVSKKIRRLDTLKNLLKSGKNCEFC